MTFLYASRMRGNGYTRSLSLQYHLKRTQPKCLFQSFSKFFQKDESSHSDDYHNKNDPPNIIHEDSRIMNEQTQYGKDTTEESKAWIPPMRPLSGDKGQSHLYERNTKIHSNDHIQYSLSSNHIHDEQEIEPDVIMTRGGTENDEQYVQYMDLDDLDLQELQSLGYIDNQDIDDEDLDQLMESLKFQVLDDDDDEEEEEEEEEYDEEEEEDTENDLQKTLKPTPTTITTSTTASTFPDWLKTRRQKLQGQMMTPSQSASHIQKQGEIPNIPYTLLSSDEIITCLTNLGGRNVQLIIPEDDLKQYLGWEGMIIATATSYSHIRVLVESIVRALRERKLSERGVIGAKFGAEGGEDPTMSARKKSKLGRGSKLDDGWMAVDCRNFIVHVQDEITRRSVDLEGLWSPGSKQGKILRQLNCNDDDAVDDYVAENPIPNEYSETLMVQTNFWGDGKYRGGMGNPGGAKRRNERWTSPRNERRKSKNRGRLL